MKYKLIAILTFTTNPLISLTFFTTAIKANKANLLLFSLNLSIIFSLILCTQQSTGTQITDIVHNYNIFVSSDIFNLEKQYLIYDLIAYIFSKVIGVSFSFFMLLHYVFFYFSCSYLALRKSQASPRYQALKVVLIHIGLINFVQVGELTRQNVAGVLFILSLLFLRKSKILSALLLICSAGYHHTALIIFIIFLFSLSPITSILFLCISLPLSFFNHNSIIQSLTCPIWKWPSFVCAQATWYANFMNWKITVREHISLLGLNLVSCSLALSRFKEILLAKSYRISIERLSLLYLIFLVANLSTTHNFIRFLNSGSIFFVILFSVVFDRLINDPRTRKYPILLGIIFSLYNVAAIYKRTTRVSYQSSYLHGEVLKIFKPFQWIELLYDNGSPDKTKRLREEHK